MPHECIDMHACIHAYRIVTDKCSRPQQADVLLQVRKAFTEVLREGIPRVHCHPRQDARNLADGGGIYVYVYVCMYIYLSIYLYEYTHTHTHTHTYTYTYIYIYVFIHKLFDEYVCI